MAARKSRPARAAAAAVNRSVRSQPLKAAHAKIAQLTAALEAEHRLAGEHATARLELEKAFASWRTAADERYVLLGRNSKMLIDDLQAKLARAGKDVESELANLQRENAALHAYNNRLHSDILAKVADVDRLQDQIAAFRDKQDGEADEVKRLRRELIEAAGDAAMHRARDERAHAALASLALLLGDTHAELRERDDDDALANGRREVRV